MRFENRVNHNDLYNFSMLSLAGQLTAEDTERLSKIRRAWNFYDGFHWEEIPESDKPQITENYCRAFINKFVAFEFGKAFTTKYSEKTKDIIITKDGLNTEQFVNRVWDYNLVNQFCVELGQSKAISGDGWVQVKYFDKDELDDPFGEYPSGMVRVMVSPTSIIFPEYDDHDKSKLVKLTVMYPIEREEETPVLRRMKISKVVYKQVWTNETIEIYEGDELKFRLPNKYETIPFVQIKNYPVVGRSEGLSDLEDLIPLNVELNMKKSDISEIIDYHSAPITVVFGARVSALEKGANKIWGGLPKDSKVQNLELNSDLGASVNYVNGLKIAMHEIGGVPEGALGGTQSISNTSGVALQFINMPLIERTRIKRLGSQTGLERVTKLILLVAEKEELITIPEEVDRYDFFYSEIMLPDTLPKDTLLELQQIDTEMRLGLETRKGAMLRLGKENVDTLVTEVDQDRKDNPDIYGLMPDGSPELNSGFSNSDTALEQLRKENQGTNMPQM